MDIIRLAISKPISVFVGVLLVVLFGLIGLGEIPIQLTPTVDRPIITVQTNWPGRSPQEVVDEITKEQEERLKNVSNLKAMRSVSGEGQATITLEFYLDTNINRARQEVSDALRQVPEYPQDVDEPVITVAEGAAENAIAWIIIDVDPQHLDKVGDFDVTTLFDSLDKEVKPYLERIDGVAEVNVYGGRPRELRVMLDPQRLALRSLTHLDVIQALRQENRNISAGTIAEGKRDIRVRIVGQFESVDQVLDTPIAAREGRLVTVRDVGEVELDYAKRRGFVRSLGQPSIAINVIRQSGANVVDVMADLRLRLEEVRTDILPALDETAGPYLRLRQVYDETIYIDSAINLVTQNLWIGGLIAAMVLMVFLRSVVSTGVIALAIPISVVGTFLVLLASGRTLNVISLAGLAFAVGMVVDNAIVVLENIYRRVESGEAPLHAAYRGTREVWGAILASTLTTVAVFVPILTIQEEAGQLFRDLSLAIVAAVVFSLTVSITVIPTACSRWLRPHHRHLTIAGRLWRTLFGLVPLLAWANRQMGRGVAWLAEGWRGWSLRPAIIVLLTAASLLAAWLLAPPLDYLPAGNRNLVFGGVAIPPGYSVEQREGIARRIESAIGPYAQADIDDPQSVAALPPIQRFNMADPANPPPPFDPVPIDNFFIGAFGSRLFVGATSQDPRVVLPVGTLLSNAMMGIPDAFGGARQSSIFGRGAGGGNTIDVEISGPNLDRVLAAARDVYDVAGRRYGFGVNVNAEPGNFNLQQQELQARLNDVGRQLGFRTEHLSAAARALFDGAFVDDYRYAGDTIDLVVLPLGGRLDYKEQLAAVTVATPRGGVVPLDTILDVSTALAPQEIQRIEELPSVTVRVNPPDGVPISSVMAEIQEQIIAPARERGLIDRTMRIRLEGTAAKLSEVTTALLGASPDAQREAAEKAAPLWRRALGIEHDQWWRDGLAITARALFLGGLLAGVWIVVLAVRRRDWQLLYGSVGAVLLGLVLASLLGAVAENPQLITARMVWALLVVYLLMAALFESFLYPFVIMFTVPLAVVGGFVGLAIVHARTVADPTIAPQQLDVLTMIGFIILIGVVVNNAILLVHQALGAMRGENQDDRPPMPPREAIAFAVQTRVRPIFMSVCTSVGGMLPLVIIPGAGSEMYRGLGSVVIGGLLMSTIFTLILVPLLLSLVLEMRRQLLRALPGSRDVEAAPRRPALDLEPAASRSNGEAVGAGSR